ncbi:MAG: hypothetical protein V1690_01790 [Candidatus Moraniibacteriota bacterium]
MIHPFLISFSGLDGSGKTQLIVLLRRFLRRQGIPYLYIHSVSDSLANRIAKRIPSFKQAIAPRIVEVKKVNDQDAPPKQKKIISRFSYATRLFFLFIDALYLRLRLAYYSNNYSVIIFDRYIYDKLINLAYLRRRKGLIYSDFWVKMFPRPNLPLFLHINPEDSLARKHEAVDEGQDMEYFILKYGLFEEAKINWKLVNIDNSVLTLSEAKKKILSLFKKRFYKYIRNS